MQKILKFLFLFTLILTRITAGNSWDLGGNAQWPFSFQSSGISTESRSGLSPVLIISGNQPEMDVHTDLCVSADMTMEDNSGYYDLISSKAFIEMNPRFRGGGSLIFNRNDEKLIYQAKPGAMLYPGSHWDDFTIEFRIYPSQLENYEELFSWEGFHQTGPSLLQQKIQIITEKRKLNWSFENFFFNTKDDVLPLIQLNGLDYLYPGEWSSHMVRYSAEEGLIEYFVNGILQDLVHTKNTETGNIHYPHAGNQTTGRVILGKSFLGRIDEFRISSTLRNEESLLKEFKSTGTVIFGPYDMKFNNSQPLFFKTESKKPSDSAVFYSMSVKDNIFQDDSWIPVSDGDLSDYNFRGRYMSIKADLYASGSYKDSPELYSLNVEYEPDLPPPAPVNLTVISTDTGKVRVSWQPVIQDDIKGYNIYYGKEPGIYISSVANQGSSPIFTENTSSFNLSGLEPRQIYYIAIRALDSASPPHESRFSNEVNIRP